MKHIFTVHSPITYLCAFSVCKALNLPESDVIIISAGYKPPFQFGRIVQPYHQIKRSIFYKLTSINLPKAYDKYINNLTNGEEFIAYIDLMHYWQRILVTHQYCLRFNFLEEGMNSYLKPDTLKEVTFVAKEKSFRTSSFKEYLGSLYFAFRFYNHKLLNLPYWAIGYRYLNDVTYFCFSGLCYPGIKQEYKQVIPFYGNDSEGMKLKNVVIWVEDFYNKRHVSKKEFIDNAIDTAVKFIDNKYGATHKHYLKLRPTGSLSDSEVFPLLQANSIACETLQINEPLELVLKRSENVVLIASTSSLLFYGKIMGHEAYTYFRLLKERRHSAFEGMNFYWDSIQHIGLDK